LGCNFQNLDFPEIVAQQGAGNSCPGGISTNGLKRKGYEEMIEVQCNAGSKVDQILDFGLMNFKDFERENKAVP